MVVLNPVNIISPTPKVTAAPTVPSTVSVVEVAPPPLSVSTSDFAPALSPAFNLTYTLVAASVGAVYVGLTDVPKVMPSKESSKSVLAFKVTLAPVK